MVSLHSYHLSGPFVPPAISLVRVASLSHLNHATLSDILLNVRRLSLESVMTCTSSSCSCARCYWRVAPHRLQRTYSPSHHHAAARSRRQRRSYTHRMEKHTSSPILDQRRCARAMGVEAQAADRHSHPTQLPAIQLKPLHQTLSQAKLPPHAAQPSFQPLQERLPRFYTATMRHVRLQLPCYRSQ